MSDIKIWMARRRLKLNEGKFEIIIMKGNLRNDLRADFGMLHFDNTQLVPCECAKNIGAVLDSTLSFRPHIDSVVKTCNFHIRNLYMIRNFINRDNLLSLVHSLIVSKIDYCNSRIRRNLSIHIARFSASESPRATYQHSQNSPIFAGS